MVLCLQMGIPRATAIQMQVLLKMFALAFAFPICEMGIKITYIPLQGSSEA